MLNFADHDSRRWTHDQCYKYHRSMFDSVTVLTTSDHHFLLKEWETIEVNYAARKYINADMWESKRIITCNMLPIWSTPLSLFNDICPPLFYGVILLYEYWVFFSNFPFASVSTYINDTAQLDGVTNSVDPSLKLRFIDNKSLVWAIQITQFTFIETRCPWMQQELRANFREISLFDWFIEGERHNR